MSSARQKGKNTGKDANSPSSAPTIKPSNTTLKPKTSQNSSCDTVKLPKLSPAKSKELSTKNAVYENNGPTMNSSISSLPQVYVNPTLSIVKSDYDKNYLLSEVPKAQTKHVHPTEAVVVNELISQDSPTHVPMGSDVHMRPVWEIEFEAKVLNYMRAKQPGILLTMPYIIDNAASLSSDDRYWMSRFLIEVNRKDSAVIVALKHSSGEAEGERDDDDDVELALIEYNQLTTNTLKSISTPFGLNAECCNISNFTDRKNGDANISILDILDSGDGCQVLNLPNNAFTDVELFCNKLALQNSSIKSMVMGGNRIGTVSPALTQCFPYFLLTLDLSYSEDICFDTNCFINCWALYRLVLDGCGLTSTTLHKDDKKTSLFEGLFSLEELSLKENNLEGLNSIQGLLALKVCLTTSAPDIASLISGVDSNSSKDQQRCHLRHIWLADNPCTEQKSIHDKIKNFLFITFPSLEALDDDKAPTKKATSSTYSAIESGLRRNEASGVSLVGGTDALEQEYLAALKGEKDISVVS